MEQSNACLRRVNWITGSATLQRRTYHELLPQIHQRKTEMWPTKPHVLKAMTAMCVMRKKSNTEHADGAISTQTWAKRLIDNTSTHAVLLKSATFKGTHAPCKSKDNMCAPMHFNTFPSFRWNTMLKMVTNTVRKNVGHCHVYVTHAAQHAVTADLGAHLGMYAWSVATFIFACDLQLF